VTDNQLVTLLFQMEKKLSDASVPQQEEECLFTDCQGPRGLKESYFGRLRDL